MPTPPELVEYLGRIIRTATHQDEQPELTNPTLVRDVHFQLGQCVTALKAAHSALRSYEHGNTSPDLAAEIADHIDRLLGPRTGL